MAESSSQSKLLAGVARVFGLAAPPRRIEVFDNSHIQGSDAVGAMIVAGPEGFMKTSYRKFNIRSQELTPGDDFAMMREVLGRRFARLLKEHGTRDPFPQEDAEEGTAQPAVWPDLVVIDGGAGQLGAASAVLQELGLGDLPVVAVAKGPDRDAGREHFHLPGRPSFMLEPREPVLYFIQRLRDEAHRFAIGTHRARRLKGVSAPIRSTRWPASGRSARRRCSAPSDRPRG